jgi:hypothetical protein
MARLNRLKLNVSILDYIFCFTRKITWNQHQWWNPVNARVFIRSTWTPFPQTGMSTQPVHDKGRMENFKNELSVTLVSTITCIHCFVESFSLKLISYVYHVKSSRGIDCTGLLDSGPYPLIKKVFGFYKQCLSYLSF